MKRDSSYSFPPARFFGITFLVFVSLLCAALEIFLIVLFSRSEPGLVYFLLLIGICLLAVPLVFLLYRLYSLIFSSYDLERDGLHIRWGARHEIIPLNAIEWVRRPAEMPYEVPWSVFPMPGAYLGTVADEKYGQIEFLASDIHEMIFLGTARCVYAISPRYPARFIEGFDRILQMGTLTHIEWTTIRPANFLLEAWRNRVCRVSTLISFNLLAVLFLWIGFRIPFFQTIALQFSSFGKAEEVLPVNNVMVIPVLAVFCCLISTFSGIQLYRERDSKKTAEIVWGCGIFVQLQFLISAFYIL